MNEEQYLSFESYLNNELSVDEKLLFEQKLENNDSFNESFKVYKQTTQFLNTKFSKETASFKANLNSISSSNLETLTTKKSKLILFKPWQYAVAATIALFIGTVFFMQNNNPNYQDYNQHEEATFTERGDVIKSLKLAQEAFNAKDYQKANSLFELILKDYKRPEIDYFYGISLLETNTYDKAESLFLKLKMGNSIYKNKATWYLALVQLKQNKYEACKVLLKEISSDDEDYTKAQKLLNELN